MKKLSIAFLVLVVVGLAVVWVLPRYRGGPPPVSAQASLGQPAPDFQVVDIQGQSVALAALKGRYVVLEWWNHGCPFVKAQYDEGKMQKQQEMWTARGAAWLIICSSAPGKQGHVSPEEAQGILAEAGARPTHVLLDPEGTLGGQYGARTTPHMFVIDPQGVLIYAGAIDDRGSRNYVQQALTQAMSGQAVSEPVTAPYGCSVKYGAETTRR